MDNKPIKPDNNKDEFDDVLEIMKKRRTKPEYSASSSAAVPSKSTPHLKPAPSVMPRPSAQKSANKSNETPKSTLKGALANTVVIPVSNTNDTPSVKSLPKNTAISENDTKPSDSAVSSAAPKQTSSVPSADKTKVHKAVAPISEKSPEAPQVNKAASAEKPLTPIPSLDKTTVHNAVPSSAVTPISKSADSKAAHETEKKPVDTASHTDKTVEVKTAVTPKPVTDATKVSMQPVKTSPNKAVHISEAKTQNKAGSGSAVSLDDFNSTSVRKKESADSDKVKVTFLGSVWFGIIKIVLYLCFVLAISSALAATIIYVANDVFAFVKDSEITADIPAGANSIEITAILNESNLISQSNETVLSVEVMKNNAVKLSDTLNTTSVLQPLKDAGITKISIDSNTDFTVTVPAGVDVSVIANLLDTVNATKASTDLQIVVNIPENATTADVGEILKEAGVIKYSGIFKLYANYRIDKRTYLTGDYIAGEHIVNPMMNYDKLLDTLSDYDRDVSGTVRITIPEGLTVNETINLLVEKGVGKKEDYTEALQEFAYDYPFVAELTADKISEHRFNTDISYRLEGYLFPDTYDFYYNENPVSVLDKFLSNFNRKFEEEYYARAAELGLTVDEVITLASMIEKEGNNPSDYYFISSVFHNRLDSSEYPYLNSDATLQYALAERTNLYDLDTNMDHPYNSYKKRGLPPGSICNPGIQAIDAALYPENTNYYYFYTKKNGETVFTRTYDEHQRIVNADKSN